MEEAHHWALFPVFASKEDIWKHGVVSSGGAMFFTLVIFEESLQNSLPAQL